MDLIVAGAVLVFAVIGFAKGFIAQVLSILALTVAWLVSRALGKTIAGILAQNSEHPSSSAYVLGSFLALLIVYAGIKLIIHYTCKFLRGKSTDLNLVNRLFGAFFGGSKAFAVAWVILCIIAAFPTRFRDKSPDLHAMLQSSRMGALVEKWNPVSNARITDSFRSLEKAAHDPEALQRMKRNPELANVLSLMESKLKAEVKDPEMKKRIQQGDISALMRVDKLWKVLRDPEVAQALKKVELGDALAEASKEK